jgi:hypothetical protein
VGLRCLDALAQPKLEMVRAQCHTLEMALEELAIIVGQRLPGAAGVEVLAQRRNDEALEDARGQLLQGHAVNRILPPTRASTDVVGGLEVKLGQNVQNDRHTITDVDHQLV